MLASRLALFEASSDEMLQLVTEARGRWGKATDLYLNFPIQDFIVWHETAEDFSPKAELHYKVGLLYGMDLAQNARAQHYATEELEFDDAETFARALDCLKESYRGLDDNPNLEWVRQKERELRYTGSDILTLANATLQDDIFAKLGWRNRKIKNEQDFVEASHDTLAMHIGMVDGAIFVNALHAYKQQTEPYIFEKPDVEYAPTMNSKHHFGHGIGSEDDEDGLLPKYKLHSGGLRQAVESFGKHQEEFRHDFPKGDVGYFLDRVIQTTPNTFVPAVELKKIGYLELNKRILGATAIRNMIRRKRAQKAAREAEVPFVGKVEQP